MNLIVTTIALAIIAAIVDKVWGLGEWQKLIYAGIVILFVVGVVLLFWNMIGPY